MNETATDVSEEPTQTDEAVTPPADPWTSQSAAGDGSVDVDADQAEPASETTDAAERNDAGQFTGKKRKERDNPYARVKDATAEAARQRDEAKAAREAADAVSRERDALRAELDAVRRQPSQQATPTPATEKPSDGRVPGMRPKPTADQIGTTYQSYEDFVEDLADWRVEQRLAQQDLDGRIASRFQAYTQTQQRNQRMASIVEQGKAAYPDFEAVLARPLGVNFSTQQAAAFQAALLHSPNPAAILYKLGTDPELGKRLAAIDLSDQRQGIDSAVRFGIELAQLVPSVSVARPDSASTAVSSTAKPPINRVGGTANAVAVDPDDLEFGPEYIKAGNAREKKRRDANRW